MYDSPSSVRSGINKSSDYFYSAWSNEYDFIKISTIMEKNNHFYEMKLNEVWENKINLVYIK